MIIEKSLDATISLCKRFVSCFPANKEMQLKYSFILEDLKKCQDRVSAINDWYQLNLK